MRQLNRQNEHLSGSVVDICGRESRISGATPICGHSHPLRLWLKIRTWCYHDWLVGQGHPSEKYDFVNWDDDINPILMGKQKMATKPPTRWSWEIPPKTADSIIFNPSGFNSSNWTQDSWKMTISKRRTSSGPAPSLEQTGTLHEWVIPPYNHRNLPCMWIILYII